MTIRAKHRTDAEWLALAAEQEKSGLNPTAWCAQTGITYNTFWYNKRRVLKASKKKSAANPGSSTNNFVTFQPNSAWGKIEICLNGSGAKVYIDKNDKQGLCTVLETLMLIEHKGK